MKLLTFIKGLFAVEQRDGWEKFPNKEIKPSHCPKQERSVMKSLAGIKGLLVIERRDGRENVLIRA